MKSIVSELSEYGIPSDSVVEFGANPTAREVRYLDLFRNSGYSETDALPTGVIESAARPAVYFRVDGHLGSSPIKSADLQDLIRTLACRADARFLALIGLGVVTVYKIGFYDSAEENQYIFKDIPGGFQLRNLISGLNSASLASVKKSDAQWLEGLLFQLMKGAAKDIRHAATEQVLSNGDVISLIGRALFTRFLVDRDILKSTELNSVSSGAIAAHQLFETPAAASATFRWLDKTFNGDLLHLSDTNYDRFFACLGDKAGDVCRTLGNIMLRAPDGQLSLDWGGLRFQHIPVDVLSQVYEHFAHENFRELAKKTSIHYTPRGIAELVVDGTFTALPAEQRADARVLDAAAGAGVFLVLVLRRLVSELWIKQKHRPNRTQIRNLLKTQLCGMDINPESLKVAALSLYLAALELDPDPQPLSDLRFDELFCTVLHCVSKEHLTGPDAHLGSLAIGIPEIGQFDIVLGNPPWTVFPGTDKKFLDAVANKAIKPLVSQEQFSKITSLVPRQAPDLAFLWKSLQWCKSGGVIGYLLHARLLFNADHFKARRLLFTLLRVTGLLNATALRKEKRIWPSNDAPFCAIVAINSKPQPTDSFYYLNPHAETVSKVLGEIRLDSSAAIPVSSELVVNNQYAFKALFKGSALDLSLVSRLAYGKRIPFDAFVERELNANAHIGYKPCGKRLTSALALADLPSLETIDEPKFEVDTSLLHSVRSRYPLLKMERPRLKNIYKGPLILFREAPKEKREFRGAIWCASDVAFCFSYYGISVNNDAIGEYLFVLSYSDIFVYWSLLTSAKFGVEREKMYLEDIRTFPIEPYSKLSGELRAKCHELYEKIKGGQCPWIELEIFIKSVYKIDGLDWQLITDALMYALPYSQSQKRAATPIDEHAEEFIGFLDEMKTALDAFLGDTLIVQARRFSSLAGWLFFEVSKTADIPSYGTTMSEANANLAHLIANEESFWTTQLRLQIGNNHWLIGQPNQARYWSKSKARLLALQINEAALFSSNLELE